MTSELVIHVTQEEISIAILEDKALVELQKEQCETSFSVGNIYLGRVKKIMPGLNAAFVDVGYGKDAFLHYLDLGSNFRTLNSFVNLSLNDKKKAASFSKLPVEPELEKEGTIGSILQVGQEIMVQIAKEPISTKGPRLTTEISIAGRNIVLIPFAQKVNVSQKIESPEERARLKQLLQSIKPKNFGVIVRTVAQGKKVAELDKELKMLVRRWEEHVSKLSKQKKPLLIYQEMSRAAAIVRDMFSPSFTHIHVDNSEVYLELKEYIEQIAPEREDVVKFHSSELPLYDQFGITAQIKSLFGKAVSIRGGAYLVIEHTEALHVIDVNSGNRTRSKDGGQEENALAVNLSAADEVARQLRLRDMGGIIVVDFIDLNDADNRQKLYDRMKDRMALDRTRHNILPLTKFGLMQITRQRVRPEIHIDTQETCPSCYGKGSVQSSLLFTDMLENKIEYLVKKLSIKKFSLHLHPFVSAYIERGLIASIFNKWRLKYTASIKIVPNQSLSYLEYHFYDKNREEIDLKEEIDIK